MKPAVFFDRDNTLIACDEYLGEADKVVLVPGAADAVARAKQLGYAAVTISNQSGVARGYFNEDAVRAVNARLDELLRHENPDAVIDRHEFCPYHPEASIERYRRANSPLRKPAPGMLYAAAEALEIDLQKSWMIGDAPRDIEAGEAAGCRTILFIDPALKSSPESTAPRRVEPNYICSTLAEAMDFIEKNIEKSPGAPAAEPAASDEPAASASIGASDEGAVHRGVDLLEQGEGEIDREAESTMAAPVEEPPAAPAERRRPWLEAAAQARRGNLSSEIPAPPPPPRLENDPVTEPPSRADVSPSTSKLESLASDILHELRRQREQPVSEFSVSKLLGGVLQMIVLFVLFIAYFSRNEPQGLQTMLLLALVLQAMTIALLIMGKQK